MSAAGKLLVDGSQTLCWAVGGTARVARGGSTLVRFSGGPWLATGEARLLYYYDVVTSGVVKQG